MPSFRSKELNLPRDYAVAIAWHHEAALINLWKAAISLVEFIREPIFTFLPSVSILCKPVINSCSPRVSPSAGRSETSRREVTGSLALTISVSHCVVIVFLFSILHELLQHTKRWFVLSSIILTIILEIIEYLLILPTYLSCDWSGVSGQRIWGQSIVLE